MLRGGVHGAGATLAGSPLLRSIRQSAEWKGTLGVNSPRAPVAGMLGATRGPLCSTGPRPSAPGLALPHPGTALSPLLFPSIIRERRVRKNVPRQHKRLQRAKFLSAVGKEETGAVVYREVGRLSPYSPFSLPASAA